MLRTGTHMGRAGQLYLLARLYTHHLLFSDRELEAALVIIQLHIYVKPSQGVPNTPPLPNASHKHFQITNPTHFNKIRAQR